jgi:hypothetical protein
VSPSNIVGDAAFNIYLNIEFDCSSRMGDLFKLSFFAHFLSSKVGVTVIKNSSGRVCCRPTPSVSARR